MSILSNIYEVIQVYRFIIYRGGTVAVKNIAKKYLHFVKIATLC